MKKFSLAALVLLFSVALNAQETCYTRVVEDAALRANAKAWTESGVWKNGFTKAEPDSTVNLVDFYEQYNKNPELWKTLFEWLEKTDLLAIPKGKHPIEGTSLIASVEDSFNEPLEKRRTESHYHNADFMFVVKGTEGFRILDHNTSTPNTEYKPDVIRYAYDESKAKVLLSTPGRFIIFFPSDWHIAKVQTPLDDQSIRVIVVKMPYQE